MYEYILGRPNGAFLAVQSGTRRKQLLTWEVFCLLMHTQRLTLGVSMKVVSVHNLIDMSHFHLLRVMVFQVFEYL